jgi:predicted transcriptional regulator YdeE
MTLVGLAARTDNAKESGGQGEIPAVWDKLVQGNVLDGIPHARAADAFYAAYLEYQSDKDGPYTFVLGAAVDDDAAVPEGLVKKKIPAGKFAVFVARTQAEVPQTWRVIWETQLARTYIGDFEVYSRRDPTFPVEIFVGIE